MHIKVKTNGQPIPGPNQSFPGNAQDALHALGMVSPAASYEPGYPIYGEADEPTINRIHDQDWVDYVHVIKDPRPKDWSGFAVSGPETTDHA